MDEVKTDETTAPDAPVEMPATETPAEEPAHTPEETPAA